jgi:lysozyme
MIKMITVIPLIMIAFAMSQAVAHDCPNGAIVEDKFQAYCEAFVQFKRRGEQPVDPRINLRFPPPAGNDPEIRSFALLVLIDDYPNFLQASDQSLLSVKHEEDRIVAFVKSQDFDEVVVLKNRAASRDAIEYFLGTYMRDQLTIYKKRSRFLFAYDGHGAPGEAPKLPGSLSLSGSHGEGDTDPDNSYRLSDLQSRLDVLSALAYQSVALLGSCYSGGIFPRGASQPGISTYARAPGAHAVTASKADQLAWGESGDGGTVFYNEFINAAEHDRENFSWTSFSDQDGNIVREDDAIIHLERVVLDVNSLLELKINPRTHEPYPQLIVGDIAPEQGYEGMFFFLSPRKEEAALKEWRPTGESITAAPVPSPDLTLTTGSAVLHHPGLKVFRSPDTYSIHGVDFGHGAGEVDFKALRGHGVRFLYVKATQSTRYRDPAFRKYLEQASAANLKVGAYHVLSFCADPTEQLANLRSALPVTLPLLPIAVDPEFALYPIGDKCAPVDDQNVDEYRRRLHAFLRLVEEAYGSVPILYMPWTLMNRLVDDSFNRYPLWLAHYGASSNVPDTQLPGRNPWTLWQYGDSGTIPGSAARVDLNVFFGTEEQFQTFAAGKGNVALEAAR